MWIDIHAHLYDKSEQELARCIEQARYNNVITIVNAPTSIETSYTVVSQCQKGGFPLRCRRYISI